MKTIVFDESIIGPWVCARTGGSFDGKGTGIGLVEDGRMVAGILYDEYNGRSICMHVAAEGKTWMTREFLRVAFDYPFNQLRVNAIIGLVDGLNKAARSFDEKLGFKLQCVIPDAGPVSDLCIYAMRAEECRWLRMKERHGHRQEFTT